MKRFLWLTNVAVLLALLIAGSAFAQSADPIKIGVILPLTGVYASGGEDGMVSVRLAVEAVGGEIAGRPIQLIFEDGAADPEKALEALERLVTRDGVQLVLGPLSSGAGMAIKGRAHNYPDTTIIIAGAAAEDITMRGIQENIFRTTYTGSQVMFPFGRFAFEELGYKRVVTLAGDYSFPYSQIAGFAAGFIAAGGEIINRLWVPLGTSNYASIMPQLAAANADAIFIGLGGTDAINFLNQADTVGLLDRIEILGGTIMVDSTVLQTAGAQVEGVYTGSHFSQALVHDEFVQFDQAFRAATNNRVPSLFAGDYYIAAEVALAALEAVNGNLDDQGAYREALKGIEMMTARGPFKFDDYNQVVLTTYITQVREVNGEYQNVVVYEYPDSTQFGPFDPEWYEAQPEPGRVDPTAEAILNAVYAE